MLLSFMYSVAHCHCRFAHTFDVHQPLEGLPVSTAELLQISHHIVERKHPRDGQRSTNYSTRGDKHSIAAAGKSVNPLGKHEASEGRHVDGPATCATHDHAPSNAGGTSAGNAARQQTAHVASHQSGAGNYEGWHGVVAFLPRNTDLKQLSQLAAAACGPTETQRAESAECGSDSPCGGALSLTHKDAAGIAQEQPPSPQADPSEPVAAAPAALADTAAATAAYAGMATALAATCAAAGTLAATSLHAGISATASDAVAAAVADNVATVAVVAALGVTPSNAGDQSTLKHMVNRSAQSSHQPSNMAPAGAEHGVCNNSTDNSMVCNQYQGVDVTACTAAASDIPTEGHTNGGINKAPCQAGDSWQVQGDDGDGVAGTEMACISSDGLQPGVQQDADSAMQWSMQQYADHQSTAPATEQALFWHLERNILNDHFKGVTLYCRW